jgi:hypothetical protein
MAAPEAMEMRPRIMAEEAMTKDRLIIVKVKTSVAGD